MDLSGAHITVNGDIIENKGILNKTYKNGVEQKHPAAQHAEQADAVEDVNIIEQGSTPTQQQNAINLDKFRALLTIPYLNRKYECEAMLNLITQDGWNKKDRARFALALYESGNVALQREHIHTFAQWCGVCSELLGWNDILNVYRKSELTPNEATKQISLYL